jgi:hypothetical protein
MICILCYADLCYSIAIVIAWTLYVVFIEFSIAFLFPFILVFVLIGSLSLVFSGMIAVSIARTTTDINLTFKEHILSAIKVSAIYSFRFYSLLIFA